LPDIVVLFVHPPTRTMDGIIVLTGGADRCRKWLP
jgi:hypothetical protein